MIKLRPHQERVIESMVTNPKGQVIVPTGGGKTLCMIKDAQRQFNACSWVHGRVARNEERWL